MAVLPEEEWLRRELDYRTDMSAADLQNKYGVSELAQRNWQRRKGWYRNGPPERVRWLRMKLAALQAETEITQGELDVSIKRMRSISSLLKLDDVLNQLDNSRSNSEGRNMDDKSEQDPISESESERQSLAEIRAELERRLDGIVGQAETKSADASDQIVDEGRSANCSNTK